MKTTLVLRYFLWSMLIFAISMISLSFRLFDSLQDSVYAVAAALRPGSYSSFIKETDIPYRFLPIYDAQLSQEQYFEVVRDIVPRLKAVGAMVVIVPIPDAFRPSAKANTILRAIARDSSVVFGVPVQSQYLHARRAFWINDRNTWWATHPFLNRYHVPWGVMSATADFGSSLLRFVPVGFRESNTGEPIPDIATIALKKYFDIPNAEELPILRSRLLVGPHSIEIGQNGVSSVRFAYRPKREQGVAAGINVASDSVEYYPNIGSRAGAAEALRQGWLSYKGMIVMLDWYGTRPYGSISAGWLYFQVFASVFNRSFVTVHNEWNVLLISTLVVFLSVFSYSCRNGWTILVSFLLVLASITVGVWLLDTRNILFQPIYIIIPLVLCGTILPVVKTAGEKRIAEERIRSLEEENRRLLDLQRSLSPYR